MDGRRVPTPTAAVEIEVDAALPSWPWSSGEESPNGKPSRQLSSSIDVIVAIVPDTRPPPSVSVSTDPNRFGVHCPLGDAKLVCLLKEGPGPGLRSAPWLELLSEFNPVGQLLLMLIDLGSPWVE